MKSPKIAGKKKGQMCTLPYGENVLSVIALVISKTMGQCFLDCGARTEYWRALPA